MRSACDNFLQHEPLHGSQMQVASLTIYRWRYCAGLVTPQECIVPAQKLPLYLPRFSALVESHAVQDILQSGNPYYYAEGLLQ